MPECGQRVQGPLVPRRGYKDRNNRACSQYGLRMTWNVAVILHFHHGPACSPEERQDRLTLVTLSPSAWKKVMLPAQLPVATTCPSGWKAMQFRDLGWVYWKASCPRTVSHSWRRKRNQGAGHKRQSISIRELLGVILSSPLPQQGFPRTGSHAMLSNKISFGSWLRVNLCYL